MTVFVIMYVLMILSWAMSLSLSQQKRSMVICITAFLVLWLIQTFRAYDIGVDIPGYINGFLRANYPIKSETEIGYYAFINILRSVTDNPTIFLSIISATFLLPLTFILRKFSAIPILSFIIIASFVLYIFSFSALRQTMAIGITTLSYYFIYKKKILPHYLLVYLATLFHSSAVIFVIAYPLCNYAKISKKAYCYIFTVFIICLFSLKSIVIWLLPMIFENDTYLNYIDEDAGMAYNLAILIFLFFIFTFFNRKPTQNDLNFQKLVFCAMMCQCLGLISPVAPRVGFYFFVYIALALPNTVYSIRAMNIRNLAGISLSLFMIYFFFSKYTNGYLNVIPYSFVWD